MRYEIKILRIKKIKFISFVLFLLLFPALIFSYESGRFTYVGINNCKKCHDEKIFLNQYAVWVISPHANSVKTLFSEKAKKIGNENSLEKPAESVKCLKCHTTGGGRYVLTRDEGVGCEACHGPGSEYFEVSNHVNLKSRENGYIKAKKLGMYPILKYEDNLKKRERLCKSCHANERPCWPTDAANIHKQKITIQVIDSLKKGDIKFNHSLRRY